MEVKLWFLLSKTLQWCPLSQSTIFLLQWPWGPPPPPTHPLIWLQLLGPSGYSSNNPACSGLQIFIFIVPSIWNSFFRCHMTHPSLRPGLISNVMSEALLPEPHYKRATLPSTPTLTPDRALLLFIQHGVTPTMSHTYMCIYLLSISFYSRLKYRAIITRRFLFCLRKYSRHREQSLACRRH